jgi:branched-chain amino acid transport system substrate-binding protein
MNLLELAAEQTPKPKTLALVNENALFPQLGSDAAAAQAEELGFEVVYKQAYETGTTDFSSILADVKAKNPDMLIASGYTGDEITITRQADELGLHPKLFGFLLGPTVPGFIDDLGAKANYLLEPIQWDPSMPWKDDLFGLTAQEYADQFNEQFGFVPDYHPPQSSAALEVFYDAIQRAGTLDPAKVRDAIAATDFTSFYGPIEFNDKGENVGKDMAVIQVQDGEPTVVYPGDFAEADLIYPIPES